MDERLTRRSLLGASAAVLSLPAGGWAAGSAARPDRVRLRLKLFPPTGRYLIGRAQLYLVDRSRRDPWLPTRPRKLMVSVWYPAVDRGRHPYAPWIEHKAGVFYLNHLIGSLQANAGPSPAQVAKEVPLPGVRLPVTNARHGAPAWLSGLRYPTVLYQPGYGDIRETGSGLASDLASRGYVVVTMDDTYEAEVAQFPGGRLATTRPNQTYVNSVRLADTRFVLDELARLRSGVNPDALQRKLPNGLSEALDVTKIGMFGHSLGGAMTARAMASDQRIRAGIDLDGSILVKRRSMPHQNIRAQAERLGRQLGQRPFMLMIHQGAQDDPSLAGFWSGLRGWRLWLSMKNSEHSTYTDLEQFLSQLLAARIAPHHITSELVAQFIGTVDPTRAVAAERAYIAAFFDLALHGRQSNLLNAPSPQYPEIEFLGR